MPTDHSIYRQLQIQLDQYPIGYPATKSGVEIDILKYFFTPLQAKIALCLTLRSIPVSPVRKRLKNKFGIELSSDELSAMLDDMFQKGVIRRSESAGSPRFGIAMLAIGMFEYHVDDLTREPLYVANCVCKQGEALMGNPYDVFFKMAIMGQSFELVTLAQIVNVPFHHPDDVLLHEHIQRPGPVVP